MTHLDDYTLTLGAQDYIPLVVGGMGVDISRPELVLAIAGLGGIAHLSDAMLPAVADRHLGTRFVQDERLRRRGQGIEPVVPNFDLDALRDAIGRYVRDVMRAKRGEGGIFLNVMEKLTMGDPRGTLEVRLTAAMDAGIDGITLSAGLHLNSFELMRNNPRFRDVKLGIIVSSARALKLFLQRAGRVGRWPDYIIVEGPLAGGHLGFPFNWYDYDLRSIVTEVMHLLAQESLAIPVIPAGGVFTGSDAVAFLEMGAAAVQVATRFTITEECGLPDPIKQAFCAAEEEDVEVNAISPTGYPMRMLKDSPAIGARTRPMCESYGYGLDRAAKCSYRTEYYEAAPGTGTKTCLCAMMYGYKTWTCGHTVSRLKETTRRLPDGRFQLLTAEHVFRDYTHSVDQRILLPAACDTEEESRLVYA